MNTLRQPVLACLALAVSFSVTHVMGQAAGSDETDRYQQYQAAPSTQSYAQPMPDSTASPHSNPYSNTYPQTQTPAAYQVAEPIPAVQGYPSAVVPASHPVLPSPTASPADASVAAVSEAKPADKEVDKEMIATEEVSSTDVDYWYEPGYWFPKKIWSGGAEIGLSGSEGNAQSFSMRAGLNAKRETDRWINAVDLIYNRANANGVQTAHNALFTANNDIKLGDSPWTGFVNLLLEYDEFRAFDLRVAVNGGVGYQFIKTDAASLIGRIGSGASTEIGAVDEKWVPEAVFGTEYEHQLSKRQKVSLKVDYFPEWTDFDNFRMVTDASWEMLLHEASNMSLKISAIDRYDSTPGSARPNDIDYALLLLWKL